MLSFIQKTLKRITLIKLIKKGEKKNPHKLNSIDLYERIYISIAIKSKAYIDNKLSIIFSLIKLDNKNEYIMINTTYKK